MPVPILNNVSTQDTYADALTVQFTYPRAGFSMAVFNASIFYQLATPGYGPAEVQWESQEHYLTPSFNGFRDPADEGLPADSKFAGVRVRSAVAGSPARITVS